MFNNKKKLLGLALLSMWTYAQAEVLVILPESGPMERAANSIKQGFMAAYAASQSKIPLKFIDEMQLQLPQLLKQAESTGTQIIVGPLLRSNVEKMMQQQSAIKILALNDTAQPMASGWQFSLSKQEDAQALTKLMKQDGIQSLLIVQQPNKQKEYALLLTHLRQLLNIPIEMQEQLILEPKEKQGVLVVGDYHWLNQFSASTVDHLYSVPNAIELNKPLQEGVKFCDTPALYEKLWLDLLKETEKEKLSSAFQRLLAFGGDAWQISESYLMHGKDERVQFQGRTGELTLAPDRIHRVPHCYEKQSEGFTLIDIK